MLFGHGVKLSEKFKWLLYVIGAAICIMDAIVLILKYERFAVIEKNKLEVQIPLKMPSITICNNIPCRANYFFRPGVTISKHEDRGSVPASDLVLNYLSTFNESERYKMGYDNSTFHFRGCGYGVCQELWFNNLYYGNCLTLNGGIPPESTAAELRVAGVLLSTYKQTMYADISRSQSFVALIHEPDTAPVLTNPQDLIIGFPGDDIRIIIAKEDHILKPPPFSSRCIERSSRAELNESGFYSIPSTPFLYTIENCVQNCLQNLTIRHCNCLLPKVPFYENVNNMTICYECPRISKDELKKVCGCQKPCRYSTYTMEKIIRKTGKFTGHTYQKSSAQALGNDSYGKMTNEIMNTFGIARISVEYATNMVQVTSEMAEYELETLLGSLGGLLGLWMGLSVISVFEAVSKFWRTCSLNRRNKNTQ